MQNAGQLKIYSGGILWKKQGGGKAIEVDKTDIIGVTWMKVPRTNQLGVRIKDGLFYKFTGFRDQVAISLSLSLSYKMNINLTKLGSLEVISYPWYYFKWFPSYADQLSIL